MKHAYLAIIFVCLLISCGLQANERVISTLNKVDLIAVDKENQEGHNYGTDYYAFNHNEFSVQVTIQLSHSVNTQDGLLTGVVLIKPNERSQLGWLIQNNMTFESKWNVQWQVTKAQETP